MNLTEGFNTIGTYTSDTDVVINIINNSTIPLQVITFMQDSSETTDPTTDDIVDINNIFPYSATMRSYHVLANKTVKVKCSTACLATVNEYNTTSSTTDDSSTTDTTTTDDSSTTDTTTTDDSSTTDSTS